jgi:CheY-like chemotaxis protein
MEPNGIVFPIVRLSSEEKPDHPSRLLGTAEDTAARDSILVVDDNLDYLPLIRDVLEWEGYDARAASHPEEALEILKTFHPRLILMDIELPGMNGLDLAGRLKADPNTSDITIVAFTGWDTPEVERRALNAGCEGYIAKPIDTPVLLRLVQEYLAARRR